MAECVGSALVSVILGGVGLILGLQVYKSKFHNTKYIFFFEHAISWEVKLPRHIDATGYLIELRDQESKDWFSLICDLALSAQNESIKDSHLQSIIRVFLEREAYRPLSIPPLGSSAPPPATPTAASTLPRLELLSNFQNFKLLSTSLALKIDKRITILFGMNGAGKSSLCDAIKILARSQPPEKPLTNLKNPISGVTSFSFKFTTDSAAATWRQSSGYGLYSDKIKYFDSTVAVRCLTEAASPESIVSVEPFRLEVFSFAGSFVRHLSEVLSQQLQMDRQNAQRDIEKIQTKFANFANIDSPIHKVSVSDCEELEQLITSHVPLSEIDIVQKQALSLELSRLEAAATEVGLRLQQTEFKMLISFARSIKKLKKFIIKGSMRKTVALRNRLRELKNHQTQLASSITPRGIDMTAFILFIQASRPIVDYDSITSETLCPYCRRPFDESTMQLCTNYHEFLLDQVGKDIRQVSSELQIEMGKLEEVKTFHLESIDTSGFPSSEAPITAILGWFRKLLSFIPNDPEKLDETHVMSYEDLSLLEQGISTIADEVLSRYRTLRLAMGDTTRMEKQRESLNHRINTLDYKQLITDCHAELTNLASQINAISNLQQHIDGASFSNMLRKITIKSKEAYRELVVSQFERTLDAEYKRLSGYGMSDFGIQLSSSGTEQQVIVDTNIGSYPVARVLSEGEQKIHALALFFAEAAVGNQNIVVFDDPVNSFDYNYSALYAQRLRDYAQQAPHAQVIILTHNWDFFVNMQNTLNRSGLDNDYSVQVIEQCSIVNEYTEKVDQLKIQITEKLGETGSLSFDDKEFLSAQMRRLIEAVVNTYVFNNQRHQFKQKTISVSIFGEFTKLVPLNTTEAQSLRDLYSLLSVPEHDDPRNHYAGTTRAMFSNWYGEICNIETALAARRP